MRASSCLMFVCLSGLLVACSGSRSSTSARKEPPGPSVEERRKAAAHAVICLQGADFEAAEQEAKKILENDPGNPQARLVAALTLYHTTFHAFRLDIETIFNSVVRSRVINNRYLRFTLQQALTELEGVEKHLAMASLSHSVELELCLACWERDWNHNGRVDSRDKMLFQVELDENGKRIPEGDPRRKPTFRFDRGDVLWARAMICFQRAALNLALAYRLPELESIFQAFKGSGMITIPLEDKKFVLEAKRLILEGLKHADKSRIEYLAETDDHGEWLPNPSQKNHPLPLPVDETLYQTWEGVLSDLRLLISGEEGLDVAAAAQLGDHKWESPPRGYINVGRLFEEPRDLVFNLKNMERLDRGRTREDVERVLLDIFGDKYTMEMQPTQLLQRLSRMKSEMERGEESLERKLRYLIWLN